MCTWLCVRIFKSFDEEGSVAKSGRAAVRNSYRKMWKRSMLRRRGDESGVIR